MGPWGLTSIPRAREDLSLIHPAGKLGRLNRAGRKKLSFVRVVLDSKDSRGERGGKGLPSAGLKGTRPSNQW